MAAYPRAELEEMVERWLQANRNAEKEGKLAQIPGRNVYRRRRISLEYRA